MNKIVKLLVAVSIGFLALSCAKEYNDTELKNKVNQLTEQVADLSRKVSDLNLQVVGLKEIIDQWKAGGYITSIDNSVAGQHTISFVGGKTVVVFDGSAGEPGQPGPAPDITIKKDAASGEYYWYVGDQKLAPASYIPTFTVNDKGEMIVTVNGQATNLGVVKGQSEIKKIEEQDDKVVFTLNDDTVIEIPFAQAFKLVIANPARTVSAGQKVEFPYTLQNANASTTVDAFAGGTYEVEVQEGKVVVTVPTPCVKGQVLVWAQNGEGLFSMVKLIFTPSGSGEEPPVEANVEIKSTSSSLTAIPASAGTVTVNLVSNVAVEMEAPKVNWVTVAVTKADYKLTVTVKKNESTSPRETDLKILRSDTKDVVQTLHIVQVGATPPPATPTLKFKRVWGKYSTETSFWYSYLNGFNESADRNVTMDDNNIYIAEAKPGVKKIWALKVSNGSLNKMLPTSTVQDAGTFPLCCPRVINYDGNPVLVVSNMTENAYLDDLYIYVYKDGISAEPTAINLVGATNGRLGDTFSFWGASATNSVDGQGLTKGLLYFDGCGNNSGVSIWKTVWSESDYGLPAQPQNVQNRYGFDNANVAVGAFWAYPDAKDAGVWGGRGTEDEEGKVHSAFCHVKANATNNLWTFWGNGVPDTECSTIESGYYDNVTCYQFFPFNGKRYVAYTKQVNGADGRLIILEGNTSDSWESIITTRKVVYQAAIQENAEMKDDYNESGKWSSHSGMDMSIRAVGNKMYIVVLKQSVGLSLFQMSVE